MLLQYPPVDALIGYSLLESHPVIPRVQHNHSHLILVQLLLVALNLSLALKANIIFHRVFLVFLHLLLFHS